MRYHLNNHSKDYLHDYLKGTIYVHLSSCIIARSLIKNTYYILMNKLIIVKIGSL